MLVVHWKSRDSLRRGSARRLRELALGKREWLDFAAKTKQNKTKQGTDNARVPPYLEEPLLNRRPNKLPQVGGDGLVFRQLLNPKPPDRVGNTPDELNLQQLWRT